VAVVEAAATLSNGVRMPWLGFGVFQIRDGAPVVAAVRTAIAAGYRSIDTAAAYGNEAGVGQAIRECGLDRAELFVTTKVWNSRHGYASTLEAFEESRKRLALEQIDLYLIHWPVAGRYQDTWRALETLYQQGLVRAIGVSNFHPHHLDELLAGCRVVPMVNQLEFHPLLAQRAARDYCQTHGIQLEAWSPLMQGHLGVPVLAEIGRRHGKTAAQVVLRWDLQHGVVTIPKSADAGRIAENADIFDFELSAAEMAAIDGLDAGRRFGSDPDNFHF